MSNLGLKAFFNNLSVDNTEGLLEGPILSPEEIEKEKEILANFTHGELLVIEDLVRRLPNKEHINREIEYMRQELSETKKLRVSVNDDEIEFIIDENSHGGLYAMVLKVHPKIGLVLGLSSYMEDWDIEDWDIEE